jgi:tetratricopeptide (TPR) repeat protein
MRPRSLLCAGFAATILVAACGWSPSRPFDRQSPAVSNAIQNLADGGDATAAASTLEDYLTTGPCSDGNIGTPETLRKRADGTFDLGLSLFRIGESFGRRFGEEDFDAGDPKEKGLRAAEVGCALRILEQMAGDETVPLDLRARARYLEGNLDFLDGEYEEAVRAYDRALTLAPGSDAGDKVGRDAAWNRAIALKREEDKKKDAGHDASHDAHNEGGQDGGHDSGHDSGGSHDSGGGGQDSGHDAPHDSGGGQDQSSGKPDSPPPPPKPQDASEPPAPKESQDERMLDQLESAPTVQQEAAKKMAARHRVRGMADK